MYRVPESVQVSPPPQKYLLLLSPGKAISDTGTPIDGDSNLQWDWLPGLITIH